MRIIDDLNNVPAELTASVVTVGKFFAVHLGHQALIRTTRERAQARGAASVVLTFDRHPREILSPGTSLPLLTTLEERVERIAALGVDYAALVRLDSAFMAQSPKEFIEGPLVHRLRMVEIVASESFRFGSGASGTVATLQAMAPSTGFTVTLIPPVVVGGHPVSSSRIARCLEAGRVEEAARLLGRPYELTGTVVSGDRLGRQLGFPTANVAPNAHRLLPMDAVYAGAARWEDERRPAAISIGTRPTVGGNDRLVEAHLLDLSGDLYGRTLTLEFHRYLRAQERFDSLTTLRDQVVRDVECVREGVKRET
jgi:riboflavin kinase/FMN adenylyltransferase